MRRILFTAGFILIWGWVFAYPTLAQDKNVPLLDSGQDKIAILKLPEKQVVMIIQTLSAIECRNVSMLLTCQDAIELIKDIRSQWKEQTK